MQALQLTDEQINLYKENDAIVVEGATVFSEVGDALHTIKSNGLWAAEFDSWDSYCKSRLQFTTRRADQLIAASQTANQLTGAGLPAPTHESQVRSITKLSGAEAQKAWHDATTVYGESPTAAQVKSTADRNAVSDVDPEIEEDPETITRRQVVANRISLLIQYMDQGKMTPAQALETGDALKQCLPVVKADLLRHEVFNPVIIRRLNKMSRRGSETYRDIVISGYLQFAEADPVAIGKATPQQFRTFMDEVQAEKIAASKAERDAEQSVMPVLLNLWTGPGDDVRERNFSAIESAIGVGNCLSMSLTYIEATIAKRSQELTMSEVEIDILKCRQAGMTLSTTMALIQAHPGYFEDEKQILYSGIVDGKKPDEIAGCLKLAREANLKRLDKLSTQLKEFSKMAIKLDLLDDGSEGNV